MEKQKKHINLISLFSIVLIFVVLFIWGYQNINKKDNPKDDQIIQKSIDYYVSFDVNGGVGEFETQKVLKNNYAVRPIHDPTYEGYLFLGWYLVDDVIEFNFNTPVINNIELIAKWEKVYFETYLIKFDSNGGEPIESQTVQKGEKVVMPKEPTRDGYKFLGWYYESELYNFDNEVLENLILVARWQKNDGSKIIYHKVTFDSNGGSHVGGQVVENGGKVSIPSMPVYDGYTFLGWYDGNTIFNFNNVVTRDISLIAKWKKDDGSQVIYHIVSFDSNGGSHVDSQIVPSGESATIPNDPMREGYTFLGWHYGSSIFNFNNQITDNIVLIAGWQKNVVTNSAKYTVTFDSNGGGNIQSQEVIAGQKATIPASPTKKWYDFVNWKLNGKNYDFNEPVNGNITLVAEWRVSATIVLISGVDLIPNTTNTNSMKSNTFTLQSVIDLVSDNGGGMVKIPAGTFYFSQGGRASNRLRERYAIKPKNNVHIVGAGTNENNSNKLTVLKPYFTCDNTGAGSMDMFYFNNYSDTEFNNAGAVNVNTRRNVNYTDIDGKAATLYNQTVYLINADFSNFVIDGANVHGCSYETDGKGFMINLFKDCDWNNVVVKNTDATGFGMDCPINATITNCMAINCGKNATTNSEGASGFGIGVGFANNESITISNSLALNNKKFGFFFEHQARFNATAYIATSGNGFVVKNSIAGGNMYDFGGLKAFSVTYTDVRSVSGGNVYLGTDSLNISKANVTISNNNVFPVYFSMYSKNIQLKNANFSSNVNDIYTNNVQIKWAINNGIIAVSKGTTFSPNANVTRFEVLNSLYKYKHMPGNITVMKTTVERTQNQENVRNIGFTDLGDAKYANDLDTIIWGYNAGIISKDTTFRPDANVTRAEFITMLYRLKGSPEVTNVTLPYTDVNSNTWYSKALQWGYSNGIMSDIIGDTFSSSTAVNKMQLAVYLYNFNNL